MSKLCKNLRADEMSTRQISLLDEQFEESL